MKKNLILSIKSGISGTLIGSFCYLIVRMIQSSPFTNNRFSIITILIASFLTGIISQIIGNEKISVKLTYIIHFFMTSVIFLIAFLINGWITNWYSLIVLIIDFFVIYVLVWIGIIIWNKISAMEINKQLNKINRK